MNAAEWFVLRHVAAGHGARIAFSDPERTLTYASLARSAGGFAAALAEAGVRREQRLALLMPDTVDFPPVFWGALMAGVVPVPVNTLLPPDQVAAILADSRAEAAVASAPLHDAHGAALGGLRQVWVVGTPALEAAFSRPAAPAIAAADDEGAFWLYSSGSTGRPKGTRHVHGALRATADTYAARVLGIRADDVVFSAAKLFFAYGLGNAMTFPLSVGAQAVLLPGRPSPDAVLATLARHRPTIFCGVPTLFAALLAAGVGPGAGSGRLRLCTSAGEPLPEEIGRRWEAATGVPILDGIGSTEMLHIFLSNAPGDILYGTTGRAVPGYALRIVDEHGGDVPDGETGELLVKGASAADGYWNSREKSRKTFMGEWTRTGDKYRRDADGRYRYQGRADDMFKVSGIWVSPFEVEAALIAHDAILEAAVVGRADADGLIKPMAFVVLRNGAADTPALRKALTEHVKRHAGPWKYPRWLQVVDDLPKTATGKIQRFRLRATLEVSS